MIAAYRAQRVGDPLSERHGQAAVEPGQVHVLGLERESRLERDDLDRARLRELGLVLLAQPRVGDRGDRARELPRRGLR